MLIETRRIVIRDSVKVSFRPLIFLPRCQSFSLHRFYSLILVNSNDAAYRDCDYLSIYVVEIFMPIILERMLLDKVSALPVNSLSHRNGTCIALPVFANQFNFCKTGHLCIQYPLFWRRWPSRVLLRPDVVDDRFSASHIDDDRYHIVRRTDQHLSVVVKDSTF